LDTSISISSWFQSTPGLVTRRNENHQETSNGVVVSIHSWFSYQEKRLLMAKTPSLHEFQSTPGLVTRRNHQIVRPKCVDCSFNPLLV